MICGGQALRAMDALRACRAAIVLLCALHALLNQQRVLFLGHGQPDVLVPPPQKGAGLASADLLTAQNPKIRTSLW